MDPVIASYLIKVVLRAPDGESAKIPTIAKIEQLIADAVQVDSLENGMGDYTIKANVNAERTDI